MRANPTELELRHILEGAPSTLDVMFRRLNEHQFRCYASSRRYPFLVWKSGSAYGPTLVATRGGVHFPLHVLRSEAMHTNLTAGRKDLVAQLRLTAALCEVSHLLPLLAIRCTKARDDPWRVFSFGLDRPKAIWWLNESQGVLTRLLRAKLPHIRLSGRRPVSVNWTDGYPLSSLLEYVWVLTVREPLSVEDDQESAALPEVQNTKLPTTTY
jgi:hypothetical protein